MYTAKDFIEEHTYKDVNMESKVIYFSSSDKLAMVKRINYGITIYSLYKITVYDSIEIDSISDISMTTEQAKKRAYDMWDEYLIEQDITCS